MWSGAGHQSRPDESPCQFTFRFFGVLFSLSIHYSCCGRARRAVGTRPMCCTRYWKRLGIPKAGLHAFRHSRVTMLRKNGTPEDLQKQWIGHSSLRTTDRYSHTHQELEYRRLAASKAGLNLAVGPARRAFHKLGTMPENVAHCREFLRSGNPEIIGQCENYE
jgi:hypothetical protein